MVSDTSDKKSMAKDHLNIATSPAGHVAPSVAWLEVRLWLPLSGCARNWDIEMGNITWQDHHEILPSRPGRFPHSGVFNSDVQCHFLSTNTLSQSRNSEFAVTILLTAGDAMFWAACMLTVYGLLRKSNLMPDKAKEFCSKKQFVRSDLVSGTDR